MHVLAQILGTIVLILKFTQQKNKTINNFCSAKSGEHIWEASAHKGGLAIHLDWMEFQACRGPVHLSGGPSSLSQPVRQTYPDP